MTRESRLLFLTILTLSTYAIFGYFKHGGIVFPFPINPFIFLAITVQFTIWNYKRGFPIYTFLTTAIFGVLANPFFWEIVFSIETLESFGKYPWIFWFQFLHALGLVISAVYLINRQKSHFSSLLTTVGIILYAFGFYTGTGHYYFLGFGLITLSVLIRPTYNPIHLLWILLFVLQSTEWLTFTLAG